MPNIQVVAIAVRLFAIWLAVWGLRNLPGFWLLNQPGMTTAIRIYTLCVAIALLLVAVALWRFPLTVAGKLIPRAVSVDHPPLNIGQIQTTGAVLLGIWVLSSAIPYAGYMIVVIATTPEPIDLSWYISKVSLPIELIIGFWLLFGARGLFRLISMARRDEKE